MLRLETLCLAVIERNLEKILGTLLEKKQRISSQIADKIFSAYYGQQCCQITSEKYLKFFGKDIASLTKFIFDEKTIFFPYTFLDMDPTSLKDVKINYFPKELLMETNENKLLMEFLYKMSNIEYLEIKFQNLLNCNVISNNFLFNRNLVKFSCENIGIHLNFDFF